MVDETDTRGQKCHFKISWDIETNSPFSIKRITYIMAHVLMLLKKKPQNNQGEYILFKKIHYYIFCRLELFLFKMVKIKILAFKMTDWHLENTSVHSTK